MEKGIPKVSVVMSCYNAEKYLRPAIESILNQTFSDFEFIIWNDGSSDATEEIIKNYADPRIRYFYHENTGLGKALNLACKEAIGEYIARMDADDISLPNRLEKEVDFLEKNKSFVLVSSAVNYIDDDGIYLGRSFPYTWDKIIKKVVFKKSLIVHPAVMYRRDAYLSSSGYMNIFGGEDRVLWGRMIHYGKFANLSVPLLNYRILPNSLSHINSGTPYSFILRGLREKITRDDCIDEHDILLHNQVYLHAKEYKKKKPMINSCIREVNKLSVLYDKMSTFFKPAFLEKVIIFIKNVYGLLFLR